jgi:F-box interacting protein
MDDDQPPQRKRSKMAPYLPPELVWEIMVRLPVKSLLRFRCSCKTWLDMISDDAEFRGAHLRVQRPCLLGWSSTKEDRRNKVTMELPLEDLAHSFAHCDGLVLMPTETVVRVFNPATRRLLTLPQSSIRILTDQVFGIGHDARYNTYKVTRFFFRCTGPDGYRRNFGMEVFTIGIDRHWRRTEAQPPYPAAIEQNATFSKGSLFWIIDEVELPKGQSAPGFLRFRLEDESFSVTPSPPHCQRLGCSLCYLAELRGELSVAFHAEPPKYESIEIWMCNDLDTDPPRWNRCYIFNTLFFLKDPLFEPSMYSKCQYLMLRQVLKDRVGANCHWMYHRLNSIIPYIPSLVPL